MNIHRRQKTKVKIQKRGFLYFTALAVIFLVGILSSNLALAFDPFVVQNIRVEGIRRVSVAAVLNELPIQVGQTITEEDAREAVCALFNSGFFKDVTLAQDGNTLVVNVIERPTICKLTLNGIKDKDKIQKLLQEVGVAEGRFYDPALLVNAVKAIEKHYFSKGKYGVRIEHCVTEEGPSLISIKFDIYEGDIAKIKQIKIVGNCVFKEKDLIKDFHSSKTNLLSWFSNDDQYAKEKLNADLETLRSYYLDRGYVFMQVDSAQVSLTPDKKDIYITIHITEGDKYCFGNIGIEGEFVVPECELLPLLNPIGSGCTFSRRTLFEVKQCLEDRLGCDGYSMAEVVPITNINQELKQVDITFTIKPGRRMYVRRIEITGNATTQDEVLRREIAQLEGTWISTPLIKRGRENMLRKGFAKEVDVEMQPVPGTCDQVDVIYDVEEARMGQISAGIGYSPSERFMLNFAIKQENFLGTGKTIDFTVDKSQASTAVAFGYQDPYFTADGIGFGFSGYYNKTQLSKTTNISDYVMDMYGVEARLVFPMSQYDAFDLSMGYDNTQLKIGNNSPLEIIDFTRRYGNKFDEVVVGAGWRYNDLDQRIFPHCGMSHSLGIKFVLPGANQQYYLSKYEFCWYYPLSANQRWILNLSSTLGFGDGYGKTPVLPFYRHFFAGGSRYVRGFEENSLGPKDSQGRAFGGNALVAGTVSLIFPNPIKPDAKSIRTALFLDAGQVYDTRNQVQVINGQVLNHKTNGMRYSVGLSLGWDSPFGPLTFSVATPLVFKRGDERRVFTFSASTQL